MKYILALLLIVSPTFALAAVESNITTNVNGKVVHVESNGEAHDVHIQNVQVVNGQIEVESTVDGKTVKTTTSTSGSGAKTTVTVDGVTRVFQGALPTAFATVTSDGTTITVSGDTVTITGSGTEAKSFTKIQLSNDVSANEKGVRTITAAKVGGNTTFNSLLAAGAISGDPSTVASDEDLSLYAANVVSHNKNIDEASFTPTSVTVALHDDTKLFGIFGIHRSYKILASNVDTNSNVKISVPWWNIFAGKIPVTKTDLEANVTAATAGTITTSTKQALALAAISNTLNASAVASAEAR